MLLPERELAGHNLGVQAHALEEGRAQRSSHLRTHIVSVQVAGQQCERTWPRGGRNVDHGQEASRGLDQQLGRPGESRCGTLQAPAPGELGQHADAKVGTTYLDDDLVQMYIKQQCHVFFRNKSSATISTSP